MSLILTWLSKALNDPPLEHPRDLKQTYKQRYLGLHLLFHPSGPTLKGLDMHVSTPQPTPPSSVHPLGHSSGSECTHQASICFWRVAEGEVWAHSYFYPELAILKNFYLFPSHLWDRHYTCTVTFWINSCHFLSFHVDVHLVWISKHSLAHVGSQYFAVWVTNVFLPICH